MKWKPAMQFAPSAAYEHAHAPMCIVADGAQWRLQTVYGNSLWPTLQRAKDAAELIAPACLRLYSDALGNT